MKRRQSAFVKAIPPSGIRKIFNEAGRMPDVMHLEIGEPDFPTPPHIIEAAYEAARGGFTHYTPAAGSLDTRQAIAAKFERDNGILSDPLSETIVTVGGTGAIMGICLAVLDPGDEVIVTDPYWPNYLAHILMAKAVPVFLPLHEALGFNPDLRELRSKISSKTRMIILNTPNNPCGSVLSKEVLMKIGEIALEHEVLVLSDEVYEKILYDGHSHFSLGSVPEFRENVITVNSLSKTYAMTGWRVGYASGPEFIISAMSKIQESSSACVSSVAQKAAVSALLGPQEDVQKMLGIYAKRRDVMVKGLNSIPGVTVNMPGGAFYAFANVKEIGMNSFDLAMALLNEARVAVVPGSGMGDHGEGYIRLSFAASSEVILEALRRLKKWVESRKM